jgi:hypothetical protein
LNIPPYFTGVISRYTEHAHNYFRLGNHTLSAGAVELIRSAHSTAETVNSEVFQDTNRLVECKEDAIKTKVSVYSFS